jgi:murein DD-endopeptidase MepM/ murein hydrolase activator NlpD
MKIILLSLIVVWLPVVSVGSFAASGQRFSTVPIDIEIPIEPTPVKANGVMHVLYELHLTNFSTRIVELVRIEVLDESSKANTLASYKDMDLSTRLARPGAGQVPDKRVLAGGMRAVVFIELVFDRVAQIPSLLRHRLYFKAADGSGEELVDGGRLAVRRAIPPTVAAPLRGGGWVALSGMSNTSGHRRTIVVVNGKARIAQRFATDWVRVGGDGLAFRGDPAKLTNWSAYGAEVHSTGAGKVVDVRDGIPDNNPSSDKKAVPITVESAPGNYIIIDIGHGFFCFYAHLQPNSIRVKKGDRVRRGQVIALLGNSGNSDSPHLHFHITNGNSPLGAEGVPYVLDQFEILGILTSKSLLIDGGWKPQAGRNTDKRRLEIPTENTVIRFQEQ